MLDKVISALFLFFCFVSSAFFFVIACLIWLLTCWWDRRLIYLHYFTCFWASLYVWITPQWQVSISGREQIDPQQTYLMISNHLSLLDILVAYGLFVPFKWVSKQEMFKLPFIGWNMWLNRYIGIQRGNKDSAKKMLADCEKTLRSGSSVYLFPEGSRSHNGQIKPFKVGAFVLAHRLQLPILPIALEGTQNALPKKSLTIQGHHPIQIDVMAPVPYADFAHLEPEATADYFQNLIHERLNHLQASRPKQSLKP